MVPGEDRVGLDAVPAWVGISHLLFAGPVAVVKPVAPESQVSAASLDTRLPHVFPECSVDKIRGCIKCWELKRYL